MYRKRDLAVVELRDDMLLFPVLSIISSGIMLLNVRNCVISPMCYVINTLPFNLFTFWENVTEGFAIYL